MTELFADTKFFNDSTVTLNVVFLKVVKKVATAADHFEKAAAAVVIFLVLFKMLGKVGDSFGKNGNLNLGRAGIGFVQTVSFNNRSFFLLCAS